MKKVLKKLRYIIPIIVIFILVIMLFPGNLFADPPSITFNIYKETTGSALSGATYNFIFEYYLDVFGQWFTISNLGPYPAGGPYYVGMAPSVSGGVWKLRIREVENTIVSKYSGVSLTSMPLPDITTKITTSPEVNWTAIGDNYSLDVYFRNVTPDKKKEEEVTEELFWVRMMPLTCSQVWINEDNNFQFIFWYPYKDNNWVRIYAMNADGTAGDMVFETDMPLDNPNLIVDLPDGMYVVKTFHDQPVPLQEFIIGKP